MMLMMACWLGLGLQVGFRCLNLYACKPVLLLCLAFVPVPPPQVGMSSLQCYVAIHRLAPVDFGTTPVEVLVQPRLALHTLPSPVFGPGPLFDNFACSMRRQWRQLRRHGGFKPLSWPGTTV